MNVFWFWAYTFSDSNWPKTPMSMEEFGRTNVDIMWQNRPANAMAATCIQSPWYVKNWDNVSPSIRVSYFKKGVYPFTSNKVRNIVFLGPSSFHTNDRGDMLWDASLF
ncbi:hypothetical protein PHBOTO_001054 [Pseudozyma hubeiensis]|nr:hypothetical protein PHBOTO_001054 [Pseudozyma hubeiensis]